MYLAGKVLGEPKQSAASSPMKKPKSTRIAALLHDVGHGPFSHVFEHLLVRDLDKTHEDITSWLSREKRSRRQTWQRWVTAPEKLPSSPWANCTNPDRAFLDQIISSAVDVDKQDFIVRDTYHTGAEYGFIDVFRLIHALDVLGENLAVEARRLVGVGVLHHCTH